ncbi:DNA-processing protein DprA [Halioxenophilus sp. WMMB6]|uniref:DNA-processing protein DprA n=1 Tax=Halioxenophilus sp. WMMB6 TaxID=3073815 RepID=UPI00295F547F|nr:DNA-processing protein DprA [Halioxenophilus sp. WMMB6]
MATLSTTAIEGLSAALALSLVKPHSPRQLHQAVIQAGSAQNLLLDFETQQALFPKAECDKLQQLLSCPNASSLAEAVNHIREQLQALGAQAIAYGSSDYPALLAQIANPPLLIYIRGNQHCLHLPAIGVVGARHCTAQGGKNASQFAEQLARGGFTITSGLALGIDSHAHRGALAAGGFTTAVMATGIDRLYPARNRQLAEAILANNGCLVTEFPLTTAPVRANFPQRNRIISGLSLGVLVVEAKVKSGSLITAYLAAKQNREVFALPGSIHNPLARGCHQLIREGAKLVETTADITEELVGPLAYKQLELDTTEPETATAKPHPILDALGHEPKSVDELLPLVGMGVDELLVELLNLELDGQVSQIDGVVERIYN